MNFEEKLENQIIRIISEWDDENIYAISFLVTANYLSTYDGINNFPEFSVGYNKEKACNSDDLLSEERWDFANWPQNNTIIIDANHTEMADELLKWYEDQGIVDVGFESEEMYDEEENYIGKGPNGYWELLCLISNIARKLRTNDNFKHCFANTPILVHDLDYSWYTFDMTKNANPNGEANAFLEYLQKSQDETN